MTMSMVGPGLTTTSYKKRKQKLRTVNQQAAFEQQHREYNKSMKRVGSQSQMMSLEDYDLYVRGLYKPKAQKSAVSNKLTTQKSTVTVRYPSLGTGIGNGIKKDAHTYSGERQLLGVATMHKSNMVPIFADNKKEAIEIAEMRRN